MNVNDAISELRQRHRALTVSRLISNTELVLARDPEQLMALRRESLARALADELMVAIPWVEQKSPENDAVSVTGAIVALSRGEVDALIRDAYLRGYADGARAKGVDTGSTGA